MVNIDKELVALFSVNGLNLLMFYPGMSSSLPSIVYEEVSNVLMHKDKITKIEYSKIVYDFTITTLEENGEEIYEISDIIDEIMTDIGFSRIDCTNPNYHDSICDRLLTYGAVVCSNGYIYDYNSRF